MSRIFHVTSETVYALVYCLRLILIKPKNVWSLCVCVFLSHTYKEWVDRSHHFEVNVFKSLCVTLRNITTEHLFAMRMCNVQLSTLFWELQYSIAFSFYIYILLFRTVPANHVLISIFKLGLKVSKIVTTETVTTIFGEIFGSDIFVFFVVIP